MNRDCECNATLYNDGHAGWLVCGQVSPFRCAWLREVQTQLLFLFPPIEGEGWQIRQIDRVYPSVICHPPLRSQDH